MSFALALALVNIAFGGTPISYPVEVVCPAEPSANVRDLCRMVGPHDELALDTAVSTDTSAAPSMTGNGIADLGVPLAVHRVDDAAHVVFQHPDPKWLSDRAEGYRRKVLERFGAEDIPPDASDSSVPRRNGNALGGKTIDDALYNAISDGTDDTGCTGTDEVNDGQGGCKMLFGVDSRIIIPNARNYPTSKFVQYSRSRPGLSSQGIPVSNLMCSGVMLDETTVLTAAHCLTEFDPATNTTREAFANPGNKFVDPPDEWTDPTPTLGMGIDRGLGYVCLSGWMNSASEFAENCEFVFDRFIPATWLSNPIRENDFAILKLQTVNHLDGLGAGSWIAMSSINSPSTLSTKTPVSHGYPKAFPPGGANLQSRQWTYMGIGWYVFGGRQYRTSGFVHLSTHSIVPTTSTLLRTTLEAGPGQSGAGVFYYYDGDIVWTGQSHFLIGLIGGPSQNNNGTTYDDATAGPAVGQFRDFALNFLD